MLFLSISILVYPVTSSHCSPSFHLWLIRITWHRRKYSRSYGLQNFVWLIIQRRLTRSFNALEHGRLLDLVQTAIDDIGAHMGKVDVRDIFYGQTTIRNKAISKFMNFSNSIREIPEEPIKIVVLSQHAICEATTTSNFPTLTSRFSGLLTITNCTIAFCDASTFQKIVRVISIFGSKSNQSLWVTQAIIWRYSRRDWSRNEYGCRVQNHWRRLYTMYGPSL